MSDKPKDTAAAQVALDALIAIKCHLYAQSAMTDGKIIAACRPIAEAALLAAQVGEQDVAKDPRWMGLAGQGVQIEFELRKELLTIEAATIERCKQVVEANEWVDGTNAVTIRAIVAALDKLKDEP